MRNLFNLSAPKSTQVVQSLPRETGKQRSALSGFWMSMILIIGALAMLVLLTVNVTGVFFAVLTVKLILLMLVVSRRI